MLRKVKAKNARSKRFLDNRAAKIVENSKTALMLRGSTSSAIINSALSDLYSLKKPLAINFTKKNIIHPFDDAQSLEFFSQKNDASLMAVGTHSKKRPHRLAFVRLFDHQVLDMYELAVESFVSLHAIPTAKCAVGLKPAMCFHGDWESSQQLQRIQNFFLDFFQGERITSQNLGGLEYMISLTCAEGRIYLRVYTIHLKKSGQRQPRIELVEMGPRIDFTVSRTQEAPSDLWKRAITQPKEIKPSKVKNVTTDVFGDKFGRVHVGQQDLDKIQTRKMKGLRKGGKSAADDEEEQGANDEDQEME
ncbi:rRNA-binding ribosome biosynthesis protein rpf2 [Sorochytrium milnesiophthora]